MLARYGEDAPEQLCKPSSSGSNGILLVCLLIRKNSSNALAAADAGAGVSRLQPVVLGRVGTAARCYGTRRALASSHIEVRSAEFDAPTNVGAAGQRGLIAGVIEPDRNHPRGVWIWAVADNFRLLVDNAMDVARVMLPGARS